jgi:hypothetical protein
VKLDKFTEEFEEEMDEILIKPEWFERWEEYFKEEIPDQGNRFEELVRQAMDKLRGKVVPQLIGQWLFVLGNACKNARLKRMQSWEEIVGAYHALIAKLIMSNAYAEFTHTQKEDRMYLEGLALWAGHDYSSTKGRDISHWADEYRRLVMRKSCETRNYLHWSTSMNRVLKGERSLQQLAASCCSRDSRVLHEVHGARQSSLCTPTNGGAHSESGGC